MKSRREKGGVGNQVLAGEHHGFAQRLVDGDMFALAAAVLGKAVLRDFGGRRKRVDASPRHVERFRIEIGREDLQSDRLATLADGLLEHHGHRIRFFPCGAAGNPDAQGFVGTGSRHQCGSNRGHQHFESLGLAEKTGDADQQVANQFVDLVFGYPQQIEIFVHLFQGCETHAARDTPTQSSFFVMAEIVSGAIANDRDQGGQLVGRFGVGLDFQRFAPDVGMLRIADEHRSHVLDGQTIVHQTRRERTVRHAVILGGGRFLNHGHPAVSLDLPQPHGPVAAGPRENDANRLFSTILRQRAQKVVDRHAHATPLCGRCKVQDAGFDRQGVIGWDHIDVIGFDRRRVHHLCDGHWSLSGEEVRHQTLMIGVQMLHEDESQAGIAWQSLEELFQGFQPSCRGTYSHDGKITGGSRFRSWADRAEVTLHTCSPPANQMSCQSDSIPCIPMPPH